MRKLTYEEYEDIYPQLEEEGAVDHFIDMYDTADLKVDLGDAETLNVMMLNRDDSQVAVYIEYMPYVYIETSLEEVVSSLREEIDKDFLYSYHVIVRTFDGHYYDFYEEMRDIHEKMQNYDACMDYLNTLRGDRTAIAAPGAYWMEHDDELQECLIIRKDESVDDSAEITERNSEVLFSAVYVK